ncbi:hypothetical protein [Erythrobacter sp. CCH5-A1]|jgi:hypothetical protein|uniref:hypothetical protein n=1 Tax=Erythrobacter sp. CCH5-A1 TaxID=1768792 RepID=UPI0008301EFA|nr:hypothetical protein [Erythrobacter sp. CCH5-A1]
MTMLRKIGGVVGGVLAAGLVIAGVETAGHSMTSGEAVFALAAAGYGLGALAGSAVCAALAGRGLSIAVPVVLGVLALINLFAFPHPLWFVPAAAVMLAAGWWIGTRLAARIGAG